MPVSRFTQRFARTMGQAAESFDVQGTLSQVQGAQTMATNLQSQIQAYGNTDPNALQSNAWQGIVAGWNAIIPGSGTALDELYNWIPHAAAGPGDCVSDPPSDPSNLSAWPHYISWATRFGSFTAPAPASFEAFAYPLIQRNAELQDNCFPSLAVPWNALLASLVASWNATHAGPAQTVTRAGLTKFGGASDPLAVAMAYATTPPPAPGQFAGVGPDEVSISVNRGAQQAKYLPGLLTVVRATATSMQPTAKAPVTPAPPTSSSSMATTLVAGAGVAALGLVALRMSRGLSPVPPVRRVRSLRDLWR